MKHELKDMSLRSWQTQACEVVDFNNSNAAKGNVIPVNACVGSGKTLVAGYAFGGFIAENFKDKTVQMFITPRIRLCGQQAEEIISIAESMHDFKHHVDFDVIRRDCENADFNFKNTDLASKHTIIVVCDKSFWGDADDFEGEMIDLEIPLKTDTDWIDYIITRDFIDDDYEFPKPLLDSIKLCKKSMFKAEFKLGDDWIELKYSIC